MALNWSQDTGAVVDAADSLLLALGEEGIDVAKEKQNLLRCAVRTLIESHNVHRLYLRATYPEACPHHPDGHEWLPAREINGIVCSYKCRFCCVELLES